MIRIEDADFANFSLTEGDIAVPFSLTRPVSGGEAEITVYEPFYGIAEAFLQRYGADPFSDAAIAFLKENLCEPMHRYGFRLAKDIDNRIQTFVMRDPAATAVDAVTENTRIVSSAEDLTGMNNLTTHRIELDGEDPDDIAAVTVAEGRILAYAMLNDVFDGEEYVEISVECALGHRGSGYASSCAALLARELCARGYTVSYKCRHTNAASARVAEKAGFTKESMEYNFVCYREYRSGEE